MKSAIILAPVVLATTTLASTSKTKPSTIAASWYAGWHAEAGFPLSNVSWDKYTHMFYSFAETTPSVHNISFQGSDDSLVPSFVKEAKAHNVVPIASIGGWSGGQWYSSNVGSAKNRTAFVKTVTKMATDYGFAGVDFDWEYPGIQGVGCNTISPNDTANLLAFLQELRADPTGSKLLLTAPVSITPYADASGNPSTNVSGFAAVLDWIEIMNYDVWGPWSTAVGPNSPLNSSCAPAVDNDGSAVSAVQAWHAAGFPLEKIVLGVAGYGHSFSVNKTDAFKKGSKTTLKAYPAFNASNQPKGDAWDDTPGPDGCGNIISWGGDWDFWGMVRGGFLTQKGTPAKGIFYRYDECTQTPYVYNETSEVMISYDNAQSFAVKGDYIKSTGLRGFAMWETGGDYDNILIDSIRSALSLD